MPQTFSTTAIILNTEKFRERDSRVLLYSQNQGLLSLIARGTASQKSKLAPFLDPISQVRIMVTRGKVLNYLSSSVTKNNFLALKEDFAKIQIASQVAQIFKRHVREGEAEPALHDLLYSFLIFLDQTKFSEEELELFFYFFIYLFLCQTGHQAELYHCVKTSKKLESKNHFFDYENGGLSTKRTRYTTQISVNTIKILRLLQSSNFSDLKKIKIKQKEQTELSNIINNYYRFHQNNI